MPAKDNQVYVFCPRGSEGAFSLAKHLEAVRLKKFDGMDFWVGGKRFEPAGGSIIICWGTTLPEIEGVRILNTLEKPMDKWKEHLALKKAGILTVEAYDVNQYTPAQMVKAGFIPRSRHHQGGTDLLKLTHAEVGYWVKKEAFTHEYRIHSFAGKSIRAGQKVIREGFKLVPEADWKPNLNLAHPWIRSWDGGWRISYKAFKSTPEMRTLAHNAVKAIGLTFGAVDLAATADGTLRVLEVNSAPGVEGGTVDAYVIAIKKWLKAEWKPEPQPEVEF